MILVYVHLACSYNFAIKRIFLRPGAIKNTWFGFTPMVVVDGDKEQAPTTNPCFWGISPSGAACHTILQYSIYPHVFAASQMCDISQSPNDDKAVGFITPCLA